MGRLLRRHGKWLRSDKQGWELAAGALGKAGDFSKVKSWTEDWRERQETTGRVLFARALALRGLKREGEAQEAIEAALKDPKATQEFPLLMLWAAMEEGLAGKVDSAAARFKAVSQSGWDEDSMCLYYLVRGVIRVQEAAPNQRKDVFYSSYARVQDRLRRLPVNRRHVMLRRAYRRCVCRMAKDAGLWWRRLVTPLRSAEGPMPLLPLIIIPGLQLALPIYLYRLLTRRHVASR
jgi:hypothetical protein